MTRSGHIVAHAGPHADHSIHGTPSMHSQHSQRGGFVGFGSQKYTRLQNALRANRAARQRGSIPFVSASTQIDSS